jgi:hypothetical protein
MRRLFGLVQALTGIKLQDWWLAESGAQGSSSRQTRSDQHAGIDGIALER